MLNFTIVIIIYIYHGGCTVVMYAQIGFRLETSRSKSKLILLPIFLCFPHVCLQKNGNPGKPFVHGWFFPCNFWLPEAKLRVAWLISQCSNPGPTLQKLEIPTIRILMYIVKLLVKFLWKRNFPHNIASWIWPLIGHGSFIWSSWIARWPWSWMAFFPPQLISGGSVNPCLVHQANKKHFAESFHQKERELAIAEVLLRNMFSTNQTQRKCSIL